MSRLSIGKRCAVLVALSSLVGFVAVDAPAGAAPRIGHGAVAYGSSVQLGSFFNSGPTALATLGCTNKAGIDNQNSALSGGLLAAGTVGEINDEVSTTQTSSTATSSVQTVSLFSNLITASLVETTATTSFDGSDFTNTGDMTLADLVINGTPQSAPVPNTEIPLPGLGTVTVNEQIGKIKDDTASMTVNALHVDIEATNVFGFPVGTEIVVGHAVSKLNTATSRILDGHGYGTLVNGIGAASGRTALVIMPCHGTEGDLKSNTTAGTAIPNVLSTGTELSTVTGVASKASATGTATSSIQNVSLLNIVTVDALKAQANATQFGKDRTFTDTGSFFDNIAVLGIPTLPDPVPPNSQFEIPGVGTLYLHRIVQTKRHIEVRMIELVLAVPVGPLAVGTDIRIGVAQTSVH